MLQSQKVKCLVLSRYPHSDPAKSVCNHFGGMLSVCWMHMRDCKEEANLV